jgi:hypothetical protein
MNPAMRFACQKELDPKNSSTISARIIKAPTWAAIVPMSEYLLSPFRCSVKGMTAKAGVMTTANIINPYYFLILPIYRDLSQ